MYLSKAQSSSACCLKALMAQLVMRHTGHDCFVTSTLNLMVLIKIVALPISSKRLLPSLIKLYRTLLSNVGLLVNELDDQYDKMAMIKATGDTQGYSDQFFSCVGRTLSARFWF
jgi:hypothetical protein